MNLILLFLANALFTVVTSAATLTRGEVLARLRDTGNRWKQAETLVDEASARTRFAWSFALPHLDVASRQYVTRVSSIKYGLPEISPSNIISAGSTNIELGLAVIDLPSWMRVQAAKLNETAAIGQKEQLQNDLVFAALLQYAAAQRHSERKRAIQASLTRSEDLHRIAQARVANGLGIGVDVMRAEALLSADRLRLLDAESTYQKALHDLAGMLGQEDVAEEVSPLEFLEMDPGLVKRLEDQNPAQHTEVSAAHSQLAAAEQLATASSWEWLPKLRVFADLGYIGSGTILGFGGGVLNGTAAAQISIPLYDGGINGARLAQDRVNAQRAELQMRQAAIEARAQNAYILSQIRSAQLAVQVSRQQLLAVKEEARLVRSRFDAGSASGLEMTNSHAALATATDQEIEAIFSFEASRLGALRALGELRMLNE